MKILIFISIILISYGFCADTKENYTMDLFSLLSFALAIAALLLSIFMAWLSWELYKKSSDVSDKTQLAVVRVEALVQNIQGSITEIVQRAVGFWIDGSHPDEQNGAAVNFDSKFSELEKQVSELAKSNPDIAKIENQLSDLFKDQRQELTRLSSSLYDAKVRTIFPSADKPTGVRVIQHKNNNQPNLQDGRLVIEVTRSMRNATATGFFDPIFEIIPTLNAELESSPYENSTDVKLSFGVGQTKNFNIHIIAQNEMLRLGEYVVRYEAKIPNNEQH